MNVAVFDLCGTLYSVNTLFAFTRWLCPISKKRAFADSLPMRLWDRLDPQLHRRRNMHLKLLAAFAPEELAPLSALFFQRIMPRYEIAPIHRLLREMQENSWITLLVSAAPDFLVKEAARRLGFYEWMGSAYENGRYTMDLTGKKQEAIKAWLPAEQLFAVSDNFSDLALLQKADARLVVTSKKRRRKWLRYVEEKELLVL